jgi:predicted trehalose synthase
MKDQMINFRTTEQEAAEFARVAKTLDIPLSQIAREATREKISELKRTHPALQETVQTTALNK